MEIFKGFCLTEQFELYMSVEGIEQKLHSAESKPFDVSKHNNLEYKCLAQLSVGTLMINNNPGFTEGINTKMLIARLGHDKVIVQLKTKLRIEVIIIALFWIVILAMQIIGQQEIPLWISLILCPAALIWFWFIYRYQEKRLHLSIRNFLQNK